MQHRPKDLSILQRDNYLIEINYCEDTLILIITVGVVGDCLVQVPAPACCGIITDENFLSLSFPLFVPFFHSLLPLSPPLTRPVCTP